MRLAANIRGARNFYAPSLFNLHSSIFLNSVNIINRCSFARRIRIADEKPAWSYRRESNEDRSWNKNWQSSERRGWNKSDPIRPSQNLDLPKQLSYETPEHPRSSVKSSPHANTRYGHLPEPNYKSGAEFGKQSTSQHRPTFYLPAWFVIWSSGIAHS